MVIIGFVLLNNISMKCLLFWLLMFVMVFVVCYINYEKDLMSG